MQGKPAERQMATEHKQEAGTCSSSGLQWCFCTTEAGPSVQLLPAVGRAGLPRYPHYHSSDSTGNHIQPDPKSTPFLPGTPQGLRTLPTRYHTLPFPKSFPVHETSSLPKTYHGVTNSMRPVGYFDSACEIRL